MFEVSKPAAKIIIFHRTAHFFPHFFAYSPQTHYLCARFFPFYYRIYARFSPVDQPFHEPLLLMDSHRRSHPERVLSLYLRLGAAGSTSLHRPRHHYAHYGLHPLHRRLQDSPQPSPRYPSRHPGAVHRHALRSLRSHQGLRPRPIPQCRHHPRRLLSRWRIEQHHVFPLPR